MTKVQHTPVWETDGIGCEVYETERMTVICTLPLAVAESAIADRLNRARLIAAAPELLEALKAMLPLDAEWARVDPNGFEEHWAKAADIARAAIAKAGGK